MNYHGKQLPTKGARIGLSRKNISGYLQSVFFVILATGVSAIVSPFLSPTNLVMIYLLIVIVSAIYLGKGPAVLTSILGTLVFDFFFIPIRYRFEPVDTQYLITLAGLLIVGIVISQLAAQTRERADAARKQESETAALYRLSRDLAVADELNAITQAILENFQLSFQREAVIFLPDPKDEGEVIPTEQTADFLIQEEDRELANWVFQNRKMAGRDTEHPSSYGARYLPLSTPRGVVGVLGVKPHDPSNYLEAKQVWLLEAFVEQAALGLERVQLAEQARKAQLLQATEKLQTALLNSISHDLRTPLVSITGSLSTLIDRTANLDEETRYNLVEGAFEEAQHLNQFVANLLDITRLEAGALHVTQKPCDVHDVIGSAFTQVQRQTTSHRIALDLPVDLPMVSIDFVLVVHVLINLLDNAIKYSPAGTEIQILARDEGKRVMIQVADKGIGIPPSDLPHIFEKFYRVQRDEQEGGIGLGLSLCKGIMEAHGGQINAQNRPTGGTVMTITLPVIPTR